MQCSPTSSQELRGRFATAEETADPASQDVEREGRMMSLHGLGLAAQCASLLFTLR